MDKIEYGAGTAVALGYFDGVHMGHRAVLRAALDAARAGGLSPAVFTFSLPAGGGFKGRRILSEEEKRRRIAALGVQYYLCPPFAAFSGLSPEQFVQQILCRALGARAVTCGENFTFGRDKAGDIAALRRLCAQAGIAVTVAPTAQYEGEPVSSTRIRAALGCGCVGTANAMLGEDYAVELPVRRGRGLGHTLGFPTINQVFPEGMLIPREGVYITRVTLADGRTAAGATGLGTRPTVGGTGVTCETFMPGFSGDVYGERARVRFCRYLWPTKKYDTLDELTQMVQRAAQAAQAWFSRPGEERR